MTRLLSPILRGGLACAFAFGMTACSDGSGFGSKENGQNVTKPVDSSNQQTADQGQKGTKETTGTSGAQSNLAPVEKIKTEVVGFHVIKDDASHQMLAYHYCDKLPEGMTQCVLFDGDGENAKMVGLEYIIAKDKFDGLSEEEKQLWHPHNYEILSGQLVAPGMSDEEELALMTELMNSYGKTYHFMMDGDLPKGEPKLMWSINHDGVLNQNFLNERDQKLGVDTAKKSEARQSLQAMAQEQEGTNVLDTSRLGMDEGTKDQSQVDQTQQQSVKGQSEEPVKGQSEQPVKGEEKPATVKGQNQQSDMPVKGQQMTQEEPGTKGQQQQVTQQEEPKGGEKGQQQQDVAQNDDTAQQQDQGTSSVKGANVKGAK